MEAENWKFEDSPAALVLTTNGIICGKTHILAVWHNEYDGMWEFLDGTDFTYTDLVMVELSEIVKIDRSVEGISGLPLGWAASRKDAQCKWEMEPDAGSK